MAVKSRADINTAIATLAADNTNGNISAENFRSIVSDISDSSINSTTDTASTGLTVYDTSRVYYSGQIIQYSYKWYKANSTTIAGAFDPAYWDFQSYVKYSGSLTIETADVLMLNSTPKILVPAISGRIIRLINCRGKITYNSVAYATNTTLNIYMAVGGAPNIQFTIPTMLAAVADQYRVATITAGAQLAINADLKVTVASGNPTAGNSPIVIYFDYQIED